jgi:hypothetical protein
MIVMVGVLLLPWTFRFALAVLIAGLALAAVVMVLPGPLYGEPPDPSLAPTCPKCGLQMIFVQYQPDADEYRCAEHGRYFEDSQGLFTMPEPRKWWGRRKSN